MKVGMLTSTAERCGIAVYSSDLADGLRTLVDLEIVPTWDRSTPWDSYLAESSGRLNECDLVHIQHEYSFWGSVLPGQNKFFAQASSIRRPIVLTAHTLDPTRQVLGLDLPGSPLRKSAKRVLASIPPYRKVIERKTFEVGGRIIVHDPHAASRLESRGIAGSKIQVIPMGVPAPNPDVGLGEAFRRKYSLEERTLIVIFGFIRPGRGYETLLDALPMVSRDAVLVMAGGPQTEAHRAYLDALSAEIESRGLQEQVVITGYLPDELAAGAMRAADVVLCPQEAGTGSYTLQVAFAYARPIIASDLPYFRFLEETAGCLLTFAGGDAQDLAAKINSVLGDDALRQRLSDRALAYAGEHTWAKVAERTVQIYEELT